MRFYLGTHEVSHMTRTDAPLFVSRRRLAPRKTLPRARGRWALDSGGFSELQLYGRWTVKPAQYAAEVRRFRDEVGGLDWAAPQDWMCEPAVLEGGSWNGVTFAGTGLTVEEHQRRTVENYRELVALAPDLPFVPVLQGWEVPDYLRHVEMYDRAGVDLRSLPTVGVGSVCRRQHTDEAAALLFALSSLGLRTHGFGLKLQGLQKSANLLVSADSMAWSSTARRRPPLPGCTHKTCANCLKFALRWRQSVLHRIDNAPLSLFDLEAA